MLGWHPSCRRVSIWIWPLKRWKISTHVGPREVRSMASLLLLTPPWREKPAHYLQYTRATWPSASQITLPGGVLLAYDRGGPVEWPHTSLHHLSLKSTSRLMGFSGLITCKPSSHILGIDIDLRSLYFLSLQYRWLFSYTQLKFWDCSMPVRNKREGQWSMGGFWFSRCSFNL